MSFDLHEKPKITYISNVFDMKMDEYIHILVVQKQHIFWQDMIVFWDKNDHNMFTFGNPKITYFLARYESVLR